MNTSAFRATLVWVLSVLLFVALPLLLVMHGLGKFWDEREKEIRNEKVLELEHTLLRISQRSETDTYVHGILRQLLRRLPEGPEWKINLEKALRSMKRHFPDVFAFYAGDREGNPVTGMIDDPLASGPMKILWKAYREADLVIRDENYLANRLNVFEQVIPDLRPFLGPFVTPHRLHSRDYNLIEVNTELKRRYIFAGTASACTLLAHLSQTSRWSVLGLRHLMLRAKKSLRRKNIEVGFQWKPEPGIQPPEISASLEMFQRTNNPYQVSGSSLLIFLQTRPDLILWGKTGIPAFRYSLYRFLMACLAGLLAGFSAWKSFPVMVGGEKVRVSIRWKLTGLFAFAAGIPLITALFLGQDFLAKAYQKKMMEEHAEMEQSLKAIDRCFPKLLGDFQRRLNRIVDTSAYSDLGERKKFQKRLLGLFRKLPAIKMAVFDKKGKSTWLISQTAKNPSELNFLGTVTSIILSDLNNETGSLLGGIIIDFLESFTGSGDLLSQIFKDLGNFLELSMERKPVFLYLRPIYSPEGKAEHMLMAYLYRSSLENFFVAQQIPKIGNRMPGTMIFALDKDLRGRMWFSGFHDEVWLHPLFEELFIRESLVNSKVAIKNRNYLVTGIKPGEIQDYSLLALKTDDRLQRSYWRDFSLLLIFVLLCLGIALFLGGQLSFRFLTPVRNLDQGLEAIRNRDFRHQIPAGEDDEFGDLSGAFNHVLETLEDLEVARIVQENLLPQGGLEKGGCRVFGGSRSANQLGGDYFDLRELSDGRILFLIGDVTGHGVSAAMVMAMVKTMVVAKEVVETKSGNSLTPDGILKHVHEIVFRRVKPNKMITCQVGILDPSSGVLKLANAGHCFPALYRPGKPHQLMRFPPSLPLAGWLKPTIGLVERTLEKGETMVFYTDGFPEARTSGFEALGYEFSFSSICDLLSGDVKKSYDLITDWHRSVTPPGPLEDDITLLLIRRAEDQP